MWYHIYYHIYIAANKVYLKKHVRHIKLLLKNSELWATIYFFKKHFIRIAITYIRDDYVNIRNVYICINFVVTVDLPTLKTGEFWFALPRV